MRKASLLTIFLIVFIDLMGFGIVLPNLQLYGLRFGVTSYLALTLFGAAYSICQFLFAPVLGRWSDRVGRRPVLIVSQVGTLIGFGVLYVAHWFEPAHAGDSATLGIVLIFASRIIDGISGGNISTASAYIADITTPENRAKGMGLLGAAFGLGFVFGPAIGGAVGYYLGLSFVPITAALFSVIAITMTIFTLPESLDPAHKTPTSELRRFSVLGLRHALARPAIGPLILMGFVNGFAFAGMEQTFSLLIKLRIFTSPTEGVDAAVKDADARNASFYSGFLFFFIGMIIVFVQGGMIHRLTKKFGEAALVIAGPFLIAVGLVVIGVDLPQLVPGLWKWTGFVAGAGFLALGSSLFNPSLNSLVSRHADRREQGEILGAMQGMASLARALGPVVAGVLFEYVWAGTARQGSAPYYVSGAMALGVGIWAATMRRKLRPPAVEGGARGS